MITDIVNGAEKTAYAVAYGWLGKLLISGTLVTLGRHCAILLIFTIVVFVDLFAKWIALSYKELIRQKVQDTSLLACIKAIPEAHRKGIINSYKMKTRFLGKIIVYMLIAFPAICIDTAIKLSGGQAEVGIMVITYLCLTELLSIIENLNDAGVSVLTGLINMIKGRRDE